MENPKLRILIQDLRKKRPDKDLAGRQGLEHFRVNWIPLTTIQ